MTPKHLSQMHELFVAELRISDVELVNYRHEQTAEHTILVRALGLLEIAATRSLRQALSHGGQAQE